MSELKIALGHHPKYEEQAQLSWGSVQAKTVRLQRQIDPGLMDIHLKFTEFLSKKILGQKNFV